MMCFQPLDFRSIVSNSAPSPHIFFYFYPSPSPFFLLIFIIFNNTSISQSHLHTRFFINFSSTTSHPTPPSQNQSPPFISHGINCLIFLLPYCASLLSLVFLLPNNNYLFHFDSGIFLRNKLFPFLFFHLNIKILQF